VAIADRSRLLVRSGQPRESARQPFEALTDGRSRGEQAQSALLDSLAWALSHNALIREVSSEGKVSQVACTVTNRVVTSTAYKGIAVYDANSADAIAKIEL